VDSTELSLPPWARASDKRRAHIARVTTLLLDWADAMALDEVERAQWRDAGRWHDALRDAPEQELRALLDDEETAASLLHGPAAALRLRQDGETRADVLRAVAAHTVGDASWARTGRALYMADFLEPGRRFAREERARLAARAPADFAGVLRDVVRARLGGALRDGAPVDPRTVGLWNAVR
jgi:HD superfamily phosphohydrolase YqeK